jgi:hypothetical protein
MSGISKSFSLVLILILAASIPAVDKPAFAKTTPTPTAAPSPVNTPKTIIVPDDYATITDAIENASSGDTIFVRSGTYDGPVNSTLVIDKSLSIIGENAQNTIVNLYPAYSVFYIPTLSPSYDFDDAITITANSCSLQNLTINENTLNNQGGSVTVDGNQTLIADDNIMTGEASHLNIVGSYCRLTNNTMDGNVVITGDYNEIDGNSGCRAIEVNQADGVLFPTFTALYNFVKDNTCQDLELNNANNNVLFGNNVSGSPGEAIEVNLSWSNNNSIYENKITPNYDSVLADLALYQSTNNTIEANNIPYASFEGVGIDASNNNLFALNNFYGTSNSSISYVGEVITPSTNIWSDKGLGNYWGNYQTRYPGATEVGNTGVGSIPYVIDENNIDSYPLISIYDISNASIQLPTWISSVSQPNPTSSQATPLPISTPSLPELSRLAILPLLLFLFCVAVVVRNRKTAELKQ